LRTILIETLTDGAATGVSVEASLSILKAANIVNETRNLLSAQGPQAGWKGDCGCM